MKIIDLLNKIANDEEVPRKIIFNGYEYSYHDKEHGYCKSDYDNNYICINSEYSLFDILNDVVEIVEEEDKKIEKIPAFVTKVGAVDDGNIEKYTHMLFEQQEELYLKLNELIDKVNSLENK